MTWNTVTLYTPGSPATPAATSSDWVKYFNANLAALMPVGAYMYIHANPTTGSSLVNGCYLECNGSAVSRNTYGALFALIGTTYGAGDGSTTFNLPDAAGRMLIGAAGAGGHADVDALGDSDGASTATRSARHAHTFTESTHNHTGSGSVAAADSTHYHLITTFDLNTSVGANLSGTFLAGSTSSPTGAASHAHNVVTPTANPASGGSTVTPGGSQPADGPAFICAGTLYVKAL